MTMLAFASLHPNVLIWMHRGVKNNYVLELQILSQEKESCDSAMIGLESIAGEFVAYTRAMRNMGIACIITLQLKFHAKSIVVFIQMIPLEKEKKHLQNL